jgi:glycosyltransferase involved in cell wall biosynthesis
LPPVCRGGIVVEGVGGRLRKIMSKPHVSVLIDTYNHERFIEQAITSVLEQDMSMADVEIVVVDDGSTDRTLEIVRRFEPRIRLLRKPNGGQASAFNFALPQTRGEIVAMLDGDDWWAKQKLRRALETLEGNPEAGIVGHGQYEVYSDGRPNGLVLPGRVYRVDLSTQQGAELFRHLAGFLGTSRMTIRRSILDKILPVPEELVIEADEYIFTLAPALAPAVILNEPLFYYGLHAGNLFQFQRYEPAKMRRKMQVLEVLMRDVPPRLREMGITQDVIDTIFCATRVEVERMALGLDGGSPLRTFAAERTAYELSYREVTWRHRVFQAFVLAQTLCLPPRLFYRLRRWYSENGLQRLRNWTGKPIPVVQMVEHRPKSEG